jgi:diguanylate cyclase (GGDEF)-like protein
MLDIDYFKVYNDKNGHVAGDKLLKKLAKILKNNIRKIDFVGRYGGEEFLLILPETNHTGAVALVEKIRKLISETKFIGSENQPEKKVTISVGVATFHGEYKNKTHLIESADALLYEAKKSGRNKLVNKHF